MLLDLFLSFLYVGCFSFGGGYAAVPLIRDVVLNKSWLTDEALSYIIAISESTPGPIMINLATYIGTNQAGILGALVATFAVALPAFVIIILAMVILKSFIQNKYIQIILSGMKPSIVGIILGIGLVMIVKNCVDIKTFNNLNKSSIIMTLVLLVIYYGSRKILKTGLSPIHLIILSAVTGIIASYIQ